MAAFTSAQGEWRSASSCPVAGEERLRAEFYLLLASLLGRPPGAELLGHIASLHCETGTPLGDALAALAAAAATVTPAEAEAEYNRLFIGLGQGELLPYGSHYLTGFLHDKPLAVLRGDLARIGVARVDGNPEPEDHVAALCEVMAGLIAGAFGSGQGEDEQRAIFTAHVGSWMPRFFADLEAAGSTSLYRPVGRLGRIFIDVEAEAFALA